MEHFLVISALGADRTGIVDELARAASETRCNIADSRMIVMGQEFALIMMLSGTWDAIAKLEAQLPNLGKRLGLVLRLADDHLRIDGVAQPPAEFCRARVHVMDIGGNALDEVGVLPPGIVGPEPARPA